MSSLINEYLDDLIKQRIFKDFENWNKSDFHFLLSLLNYPSYNNLALVILTNLKNWIIYSNGHFFYPIEKLNIILEKYNANYNLFEEIQHDEPIKLNISKKNKSKETEIDVEKSEENLEEKEEYNLLDFNFDNGFLHIGDFLSIDTFKFMICSIIFFIIFSILSLFSINRLISSNRNYEYNNIKPLNLKDYDFENLLNIGEKMKNNYTFESIFNNEDFKKISNEGIIKTILKKLLNYF